MLGAACVVGAIAVVVASPSLLAFGLALVCLSQSVIYFSAPSHSLLSLASAPQAAEPDRGAVAGSYANESRLGLQIGLAALLLGGLILLASLWPAPNHSPWWYAWLNPQPLLNPQVERDSHLFAPTETPLPTLTEQTLTPAATSQSTRASPTATAEITSGASPTFTATAPPPTATPRPTVTALATTPPAPTATAPAATGTPAPTAAASATKHPAPKATAPAGTAALGPTSTP